jgi:hypothetical protein
MEEGSVEHRRSKKESWELKVVDAIPGARIKRLQAQPRRPNPHAVARRPQPIGGAPS